MWIRNQLFNLMRIQIQLFTFMRIRIQPVNLMLNRILLLIKVMGICDHWSIEPPGPYFWSPFVSLHGPSRLYFEPLKLLNFIFTADSDLTFHYNAIWIQLPQIKVRHFIWATYILLIRIRSDPGLLIDGSG
jgi:hypothetical protein